MERCKVFEIRLGLNRGRTRIKLRSNYDEIIINLIIIKNIIKYIKLLKNRKKMTKIVAYDTCFSHNPAAGKWTRQHQMLVGGKAWDITAADLLALANVFDIRRPGDLLERVAGATARWPEFADRAGVPHAEMARIKAYQPAWTRDLARRSSTA